WLHHRPQVLLRLKADPRDVWHADVAVLDRHAVGEAAERGKDVGIGFVAAEAEPDRNVEGELVAAMRHAAPPRPARLLQHGARAEILDEAVGQGGIELQYVAVRPQPAVADEVARILHREQVLAGRKRANVTLGERRVKE